MEEKKDLTEAEIQEMFQNLEQYRLQNQGDQIVHNYLIWRNLNVLAEEFQKQTGVVPDPTAHNLLDILKTGMPVSSESNTVLGVKRSAPDQRPPQAQAQAQAQAKLLKPSELINASDFIRNLRYIHPPRRLSPPLEGTSNAPAGHLINWDELPIPVERPPQPRDELPIAAEQPPPQAREELPIPAVPMPLQSPPLEGTSNAPAGHLINWDELPIPAVQTPPVPHDQDAAGTSRFEE